MIFNLTEDEKKSVLTWLNKHDLSCRYASPYDQGTIGGRLTYCFTPTSLGVVYVIKCACGAEEDITNYKDW